MTEHDKVEHTLPNGDILIVDSTRHDETVSEAFDRLKQGLRDDARETYRELREADAAA